MKEKNLITRHVPEDLHQRAKAAAALKGQTLNDYVIEAIQKAVEAEKPPKSSAKKITR